MSDIDRVRKYNKIADEFLKELKELINYVVSEVGSEQYDEDIDDADVIDITLKTLIHIGWQNKTYITQEVINQIYNKFSS